MKIIYVSEYFPYYNLGDTSGGVESRCANVGNRISKNHELVIITSWRKGQKREHYIGNMRILRVGPHLNYSNEKNIMKRLVFSIAAYNTAKKIKSDIIEGHNFISYLPAYYAGKKNNSKKIATYHEVWLGDWVKTKGILTGLLGSIWEKWVLSLKWDKIISVSSFTAEKLKKNKIEDEKISIIYNGIDVKKYKNKEKKYEEPTICVISRLTPNKRIKDIIKATYILKKDNPKIRTLIIGKGNEINKLKNLVKKLKIVENVIFLGYIKEHNKMIKVLKKSHVFCLPSILEGFGIVIIEAMATKTPYVCSDIEVLKEITKDGKGGLLFKKRDYKDLAEKIKTLLYNMNLYEIKKRECSIISKKYDWSKLSKQIENEYGK